MTARTVTLPAIRSVPAWVWLAGLVALSAGFRYALGRRVVAPWIMVDEVIYSELAKSFAATGELLIREQPAGLAYGFVYPVLISPAYLLFEAVPDAYSAAKLLNAVAMSLAAVPAYLLARRVVPADLALLAAVLTVAVPALLYTGTLMTENAFYPLFLLSCLALMSMLERPSPARMLLFGGAVVLALFTRVQALALVPAALTAPALLVWYDRRGFRGLRPFLPLYASVAAAGVGMVVVQAARGRSPEAVLGAYQAASDLEYSPGPVLRSLVYHLAELDLAVGIIPFAALLLLTGIARELPGTARAFVAAAVSLTAWLVLQVATFASALVPFRIEERNMFYVAPLAFIALLVWVHAGLPRPRAPAMAAALAAGALPAFLPYSDLIATSAVSDTFALLPLWSVHLWGVSLDRIAVVVAVAGGVAAALVLLLPRRLALVLPGLVLAYLAVSIQPVESRIREASIGALFQGTTSPERDWIDRAAGRAADVAIIWSGRVDRLVVNENEFFNRSVRTVYHLAGPTPGALAETRLTLDRATGRLVAPGGRAVRPTHVLTDSSVPVAGLPVARDEPKGLVLSFVSGPLGVTHATRGLFDDGWSGPRLTYTRYGCRKGSLTAHVESDPKLFRRAQRISATVRGEVVARGRLTPSGSLRLVVPMRPAGARCTVSFSASRTAVPADVQRGSEDRRRLGARFLSFTYAAP